MLEIKSSLANQKCALILETTQAFIIPDNKSITIKFCIMGHDC